MNNFKEKLTNLPEKDFVVFLKKNVKIVGIIAALVVCYYVLSKTVLASKKDTQANSQTQFTKAVEVEVIAAKIENITSSLEVSGKVEALNIASIRPQVDGIIKEALFVEGSYVKEGQQLYQIDDRLFKINVKKAAATLKTLKLKLDRFQKLIKIGAISEQEFNDLEAEYKNAVEDLKQAKTNLEYSKVYAPLSGYIGELKFTKGALVTAGQSEELALINQIDEVLVTVRQSSKDFRIISTQKEEITAEIILDKMTLIKDAKITFFENVIDSETDSFLFKILVKNQDLKLVPGMFVDVKIYLKPYESVIIPIKSAYRDSDGGLFTWIIDKENTAKKRKIIANKVYKNNWIVEEGLESDDIVVLEGVQKISEGALVTPVFSVDQLKK